MSARNLYEWIKARRWDGIQEWLDAPGALESQHLEFKCAQMEVGDGRVSGKTRADLAKAMSGLANAEGGLIVIGLAAEKPADGGDDRVCKDCYVPGFPAFARTMREQVSGLTNPDVRGVELLDLPDPIDSSRGVLIVYVPLGEGGPYRTRNNLVYRGRKGDQDVSERYYLRVGANTGVMSHATLAAMFGRRPEPRLRLVARVEAIERGMGLIRFWVRNVGRGSARVPAVRFEQVRDHQPSWRVEGVPRSTWQMADSRTDSAGRSHMIIHSRSDFVVYPGMEEPFFLAESPTLEPDHAVQLQLRGVLYALDAQPVRFDELVRVGVAPIVLPADLGGSDGG